MTEQIPGLAGRFSVLTNQMELRGNPVAIGILARALRSVSCAKEISLAQLPGCSAASWDGFINRLTIVATTSRVIIKRADDVCNIAGAPSLLSGMADRIEIEASKGQRHGPGQGCHIHFEYFPGAEFVGEGCEPLIVAVD